MFIDFEYRESRQEKLELVAAVMMPKGEKASAVWLHKDYNKHTKLKDYLLSHKDEPMVCFNATAEARCFITLGLDPFDFQWVDLFVAYRMLRNSPGTDRAGGLVKCCQDLFITYKHEDKKEEMRDLILSNTTFSKEDQRKILYYCLDDVRVLEPMAHKIIKGITKTYKISLGAFMEKLKYLSLFPAAMAVCEQNGMPIDVEAYRNFITNYKPARFSLLEQCTYPFYVFDSKKNDYVSSYAVFADFLISHGYNKGWPITGSGMFSKDIKTLKSASDMSTDLKSLHDTEKIVNQLRYFNPDKNIMDEKMGDDGRMRSYFNPFGTQTGRNAPPATGFVLAMSSVFRVLIRAPEGKAITGVDWSSQEFALAAALSRDESMMKAYYSGDPYLYFAKEAGAVPPEGTKKEYAAERLLFKSTTLGLQYGMGAKSLAAKLSVDTGKSVSIKDAKSLIQLHKKVYSKYWEWISKLDRRINRRVPLFTLDGWGIQTHPEYINSLRNFLVQGSGASIMRLAVIYAIKKKLKVMCPLHDAVYIEHDIGDTRSVEILKDCMDSAVRKFFPALNIRLDCETHGHNDKWVEEKAQKEYKILAPFFEKNPEVSTRAWIRPKMAQYDIFDLNEELKNVE